MQGIRTVSCTYAIPIAASGCAHTDMPGCSLQPQQVVLCEKFLQLAPSNATDCCRHHVLTQQLTFLEDLSTSTWNSLQKAMQWLFRSSTDEATCKQEHDEHLFAQQLLTCTPCTTRKLQASNVASASHCQPYWTCGTFTPGGCTDAECCTSILRVLSGDSGGSNPDPGWLTTHMLQKFLVLYNVQCAMLQSTIYVLHNMEKSVHVY